MIPSTVPNNCRGMPAYFSIGFAKSIAIRFNTINPSSTPNTSLRVARSGVKVIKMITAATPYGVTIVGNASGETASRNDGSNS